MQYHMTAEEQYRGLAKEARALADTEIDPYEKRQLLLASQHYDVLADRVRRPLEGRRARKIKSA